MAERLPPYEFDESAEAELLEEMVSYRKDATGADIRSCA
jgi:hypothetical protein